MIVTTTLIFVQIPYVKHLSWFLALAWVLFFGFIDGLFWGAALRKVPLGAWVPLLVGFVVCVSILKWSPQKAYPCSQHNLHGLLDVG
jgi:KUP system potassium uptake protein